MGEDIVERLRRLNAALGTIIIGELGWLAADEIERLRAEVSNLWEFIDEMPSGADAFDCWQEARRG